MAITVLLADDHPIVREGLGAVLSAEPDIEVVGACGCGDDAVRVAAELRPDVVLMDLRMPGLDGFAATRRIVAGGLGRILVLTTYDADSDILGAVAAGAAGYLPKDTPRRELVAGIRDAACGQTVLAPRVAARLVTRTRGDEGTALTPREIDVLGRVARGLSNQQAARDLYVSEATVKTHLLHIFEKLGVNDRTSAVATAIARGILQPPSVAG